MDPARRRRTWHRRLVFRLLSIGLGAGLALLAAEIALFVADHPRFYKAHSSTDQFGIVTSPVQGLLFYRNCPSSTIRFVYDGNPRDYFGLQNEVDHVTNSDGFRGPEFARQKPEGAVRLLFLGDSFTFGEGVRFEDTFAEVAAREMNAGKADSSLHFESYNLGVGGYNTTQSLLLLELTGLSFSPDVVVLGYVPNDAEPALFDFSTANGEVRRRDRERDVPEGLDDVLPPEYLRLRTAQLVWQFFRNRQRTDQLMKYYRAVNDDGYSGYQASQESLREIARICRARAIPFIVVLFPILFDLTEDYPVRDVHEKIARDIEDADVILVDLLPRLLGKDARELWVHPTDQHPNECVHKLAAEALVDELKKIWERQGDQTGE